MWECPVCGEKNNHHGQCHVCGFDRCNDLTAYPTISFPSDDYLSSFLSQASVAGFLRCPHCGGVDFRVPGENDLLGTRMLVCKKCGKTPLEIIEQIIHSYGKNTDSIQNDSRNKQPTTISTSEHLDSVKCTIPRSGINLQARSLEGVLSKEKLHAWLDWNEIEELNFINTLHNDFFEDFSDEDFCEEDNLEVDGFEDLSDAGDKSVRGWHYGTTAWIGANGNVIAPEDCSDLFFGLSQLQTINGAEHLDTSQVTVMSCMFDGCSALTTVNVRKWEMSQVSDVSSMFDGCAALTELDVSQWNTSQVTDMPWMFKDCTALTTVDVSQWNTSKVTNMRCMFDGCSALTSLNLSQWDTSQVTDMSWMFDGCASLTVLDVSRWDTSRVTDMYSMFRGCATQPR